MVAGALILNGVALPIGYTIFFSIYEIVPDPCACRRPGDRPDQRPVDHQAQRRAFHRDARDALYRARPACSPPTAVPSPISSVVRNTRQQASTCLAPAAMLGLPVSIWILIVLALLAAYVAHSTPIGRHIFAVGGNERAAPAYPASASMW